VSIVWRGNFHQDAPTFKILAGRIRDEALPMVERMAALRAYDEGMGCVEDVTEKDVHDFTSGGL
jgi:hypothetical protein